MRDKGFTLVELIVVMMIIAILSAVAVPFFSKFILRAQATEAVAGMGALYQCQRLYRMEHGHYYDGHGSSGDILNDLAAYGLSPDSLQGAYVTTECYRTNGEDDYFTIDCDFSRSTSSKISRDLKGYGAWGEMYSDGCFYVVYYPGGAEQYLIDGFTNGHSPESHLGD